MLQSLSSSLHLALAFDPSTYLGAAVRSHPEYNGSSDQGLMLIPLVRYYGPILFARTTQGFLEGGARAELVKGLAAGVQIAYEEENDRTGLDPSAPYGVHMWSGTRTSAVRRSTSVPARASFRLG